MAHFVIEANLDTDEQMEGGRNVVHRWSVVLEPDDLVAIQAGKPIKLGVKLPNVTAKHVFFTVKGA